MKWDQQRPAKAAVERCRVASTSPPQGLSSLFLIYPPTGAQWRARPGGLWGGFPDPAKLVCMGFAKNGLASPQQPEEPGAAPMAWADPRTKQGGRCCTHRLPTDLPTTSHLAYPPTTYPPPTHHLPPASHSLLLGHPLGLDNSTTPIMDIYYAIYILPPILLLRSLSILDNKLDMNYLVETTYSTDLATIAIMYLHRYTLSEHDYCK
jgi:hypothetical protein